MTPVTIKPQYGATHSRQIRLNGGLLISMFQHVASLQSVTRSLVAALALLVVVMLISGGLAVGGPTILTFSIWVSLLGLVAVGAFVIARAQRPVAGAGAIVAAVAVWMA